MFNISFVSITIYRKRIVQQHRRQHIPRPRRAFGSSKRFTGGITRLLAFGRRYTGGDTVPLVLGALLLVVAVAGGVLHHVAEPRLQWMNVNVSLALAPVALATILFGIQRRGLMWWLGAAAFLLLLPNTPYILTDVVHLRASVAAARAAGATGIGMAATFAALFSLGILGYTYVFSLIVADLRRQRRMRLIWPVVVATNLACAIGVWLGRVSRLNSWDAARPHRVVDALRGAANPRAAIAIAVVFVVVGVASLVVFRVTARAARR
jgi:uncharacterized membrane protein